MDSTMPSRGTPTPDTSDVRGPGWRVRRAALLLLWLAAGLALVSTLLAGAIPIRSPHAIGGIGFSSYVTPGLLYTILLVAGAYAAGRRPGWTLRLSVLGVLVGLLIVIVVGFTLAYVCFDVNPAAAAREGCTGTLGATSLAGTSIICLVASPALCLLAFLTSIVAAFRR